MRKPPLVAALWCVAAALVLPVFAAAFVGAQCIQGALRVDDSSGAMRYSLPVWSMGEPVTCNADGRYSKGRKLSPSAVDGLIEATRAAHRAHLASLKRD